MTGKSFLGWIGTTIGLLGLIILELGGFSAAQNSDIRYVADPPRVRVNGAVPRGAQRRGNAVTSPVCDTSVGPLICYTPAYLRAAYNYPSALDGRGQTIVIVDAFGSPTIKSDLSTFD